MPVRLLFLPRPPTDRKLARYTCTLAASNQSSRKNSHLKNQINININVAAVQSQKKRSLWFLRGSDSRSIDISQLDHIHINLDVFQARRMTLFGRSLQH